MENTEAKRIPPAPLYRDPIYDGAADPTVIYNPNDGNWYMLYTQRRASAKAPDVSFACGSDIGVAVSEDNGLYWYYLGALDLNIEWGHHTFWAPEVIYHDGIFHMYVSRIRGVNTKWRGRSYISHYTSKDLFNWTYVSDLNLESGAVIDACIYPLPKGGFRMWYRNSSGGDAFTWAADSDDLYNWKVKGPVIHGLTYHEGQNVFKLSGYYFLIADMGRGLYVFRSDDLENWTKQENIMAQVGRRIEDGTCGQHADVVSCGDNAYIFYFTHPERTGDFSVSQNEMSHIDIPYRLRRSSIQVAKLHVKDGLLCCDRDADFEINLYQSERDVK